MEDCRDINALYYCARNAHSGKIYIIRNKPEQVVGNYSDTTGDLEWSGLMTEDQKKQIENWLRNEFPPK